MNFENKQDRKQQAIIHTEEMSQKYKDEINHAIVTTKVYGPKDVEIRTSCKDINKMSYGVDNIDSVSAIFKYHKDDTKMAVLNFASYKKPGGGFINGSKAQEECLCYESFLYNVLSEKNDFYEWNNHNINKLLYLNRGLYTENVVFEHEGNTCTCDVITCAAPNKSAAMRHFYVSKEKNTSALTSRIKFLLDIAKDNHVETLILGGFGCGVFGQDATEVATICKNYLLNEYHCFSHVIFAIPDEKDGNYLKFCNVFDN